MPQKQSPRQGSKYKWGTWKVITENMGRKAGKGGMEAKELMKMLYAIGEHCWHLVPSPAGTL